MQNTLGSVPDGSWMSNSTRDAQVPVPLVPAVALPAWPGLLPPEPPALTPPFAEPPAAFPAVPLVPPPVGLACHAPCSPFPQPVTTIVTTKAAIARSGVDSARSLIAIRGDKRWGILPKDRCSSPYKAADPRCSSHLSIGALHRCRRCRSNIPGWCSLHTAHFEVLCTG